jgi:hypothetical protein
VLYDTIAFYLGSGIKQIDEVCIPAFLLIAAIRIRPWRQQYLSLWREGAMTIVVVLAVASSLVNGVPPGTWLPGLLLLVKVVAFLYLVMWHEFTSADIRQFGVALLSFGVVITSLGYVELVNQAGFRSFFGFNPQSVPRGQLPSIMSIFQHPEMLAWLGGSSPYMHSAITWSIAAGGCSQPDFSSLPRLS